MMKIHLDSDAFYRRCWGIWVLWGIGMYWAGIKEGVSAMIAFVFVGIPLIILLKIVIVKWLFGEKYVMEINENRIKLSHSYRFESPREWYFDMSDVTVSHRHLPCFEAIVLKGSHTVVLYKFMFSNHDFEKLKQIVSQKEK